MLGVFSWLRLPEADVDLSQRSPLDKQLRLTVKGDCYVWNAKDYVSGKGC